MTGSARILYATTLPTMICAGTAVIGWILTYSSIVDSEKMVYLSTIKGAWHRT